jgi:hypothetical protein
VLTAVATLPLSDGTIAAGQIFEPTPSPSLQSADTDEPIRHRAINQEPTHQPLLVQAPNQTEGGRTSNRMRRREEEDGGSCGRRSMRVRQAKEQEQLASAFAARGRRRKGRRDSRGGGRWAVGGPARPRNGSCRPRWLVACGVGWVCSLVGQEPGGARASAAAGARQEGGGGHRGARGRVAGTLRHSWRARAGACSSPQRTRPPVAGPLLTSTQHMLFLFVHVDNFLLVASCSYTS